DTGEVLYSCEGVRLDDAQWGVVEEAPADSDRWRTIVARVSLPDEVEVGIATLGLNYPGAKMLQEM
ncbi:MAG: hypothetical protein JW909_01900, partial [Planctomycetes bacterium]|nr:hypothetical protein [Planctomycetota bacterium]